ncbi:MAG: glycoside hydrolase family 3 N-terminal domain-containing protein, partial [Propionibacteriaceae bacterium]|nr:glycoside hydrolase family 3 N-terminal domain-containing protein [Propionibacteriaceae bacterium]
ARELKAAGVDVDLAPVADVVAADRVATNEPVGKLRRHYGTTPEQAIPLVEAFVAGMSAEEIATSVKHFPGLGHVVGNTDFAGNVEDDIVGADDPGLEVFRAGIDAGADMVMVSTASYALIDPGTEATFSSAIITDLLRGDLGFDGVVISDDLGAAAQVAEIPAGERAVRFLSAGGDIVINGDPSLQAAMTKAVLDRAGSDPEFAEEITTKAGRVVTMKANRGAVDCSG